jgi:hypothetical protein
VIAQVKILINDIANVWLWYPLKEFVVLRPSRDHEKQYVTYGPGPAQAGPERGPE